MLKDLSKREEIIEGTYESYSLERIERQYYKKFAESGLWAWTYRAAHDAGYSVSESLSYLLFEGRYTKLAANRNQAVQESLLWIAWWFPNWSKCALT